MIDCPVQLPIEVQLLGGDSFTWGRLLVRDMIHKPTQHGASRVARLIITVHGDSETSGCSYSCPLTGDLTSSACVCGCVVNDVSATAATRVYVSENYLT